MYSVLRQHVTHLMFELPEDGTDVPKHEVAAKDHAFNVCL
jgi:hypothetical protein